MQIDHKIDMLYTSSMMTYASINGLASDGGARGLLLSSRVDCSEKMKEGVMRT